VPREFNRSQRVSSQIQRELAIILQSGVKDPRLGFVTVSDVDLSQDLSVAKVYFTVLNADASVVNDNLTILNQSIPFIRRELGRRLRMRNCPEIRFLFDDSVERGMRIAELISDNNSDNDIG